MKKSLAAGVLIAVFAFSSVPLASAQTLTAGEEQALIQTLLAQISVLQQQIASLVQQKLSTQLAPTTPSNVEVQVDDNGGTPTQTTSTTQPQGSGNTLTNFGGVLINKFVGAGACQVTTPNDTSATVQPGGAFCAYHSILNSSGKTAVVTISMPNNTAFGPTQTRTITLDNGQTGKLNFITSVATNFSGTVTHVSGVVVRPLLVGQQLTGTLVSSINTPSITTTTGPSVVLSASPAVINPGQSTTLTLSTTGDNCTTPNTPAGGPVRSGTVVVAPSQTTTYTTTCTDSSGRTGFSTATVTVLSVQTPAAATSVTLSANPSAVDLNKSTTLFWNANGPVTNCTITRKAASDTYLVNGLGSLTTLPLNANPAETFNVSCLTPSGTTISNSLAVPVNQTTPTLPGVVPGVTASVDKTSITAGGQVTFSVSSTNGATACSVSLQIPTGSPAVNMTGWGSKTSGSLTVNLPAVGTYVFMATCANSVGTGVSNQASVTVTPSTTTPTGIPTPVLTSRTDTSCGGGLTVSWAGSATSSGWPYTTQIYRDGSLFASVGFGNLDYHDLVVPGSTHNYSVVATDGTNRSASSNTVSAAGSIACGTPPTVPTTPAPSSGSISLRMNGSAGPITVTSGSNPTLSWTISGASSCLISDSTGRYSYLQSTSNSVALNPAITQSTTFNASCAGGVTANPLSVTVTGSGTLVPVTPSVPPILLPASDDPFSSPTYSKTSSQPLSSSERTATYTYPSSPCGSLMTQFTAPGSVSVGRGAVYTLASQACGSLQIPSDSSFRTYSCSNSSQGGTIVGTATFAFQCVPKSTSNVLDGISALLEQIRQQINSGNVR